MSRQRASLPRVLCLAGLACLMLSGCADGQGEAPSAPVAELAVKVSAPSAETTADPEETAQTTSPTPAVVAEATVATEKTPAAPATATVDDTPRPPATVADAAEWLDLRNFPMIEGAKLSGPRRQIGELHYDAPGALQAAFDFQRKGLEERGWKLLPDGRLDGENPMADFTQHGFLVSVSAGAFSQTPDHVTVWLKNHGNVLPATLPVPEGVEPFYSTRSNASYVTTQDAEETAEAVWKLMLDAGWQPYGKGQSFRLFKQNAILLNANVRAHPAQPGKTFISYTTEQLSADIPVPADVPDPRYTDSMKRLHFDHEGVAPEAIAEYYNTQLPKLGWKPTSDPLGDDPVTVIYRNEAKEMITLKMKRYDTLTRVDLDHFTVEEVAELEAKVEQHVAQAAQEKAETVAAEEALKAAQIDLPLPGKATQVKQDADKRRVEFRVAPGAGEEVFTAYTEYFTGEGWETEVTAVSKNFGIAEFEKGGFSINLEFEDFGLGDGAEVEIESDPAQLALKRSVEGFDTVELADAEPRDEPLRPAFEPEAGPDPEAEGDEGDDGRLSAEKVVVPKAATELERDPDSRMVIFRSELTATKIADFYRGALEKAGWSEIDDETFVDDELGIGSVGFENGDLYIHVVIQDGQPDSKSRVLLDGDGLRWPGDDDPFAGDVPEGMEEEPAVALFAGAGTCEGKITYGEKTYELKHALAALRTQFDEPLTQLYASSEPFTKNAVARIAREEASIGELAGTRLPPCLELRLAESHGSLSCFVDGASINLSGDKIKSTLKRNGTRLQGRVSLEEPDDVFGTPFRFELKVDLELAAGESFGSEPLVAGLAVDERYELPLPRDSNNVLREGSPYMTSMQAEIDAELADVATFYRAQLEAQGWEEDADVATEEEAAAHLAFTGEKGPLLLELKRRRGNTMIVLTLRQEKLAREHGIAPGEGKAMLILGNATEADVEIKIDGKVHKLAAGQGARDPAEAVKLPIEPGEHTASAPGSSDEKFTVPSGATWGVVITPGGVFADRIY